MRNSHHSAKLSLALSHQEIEVQIRKKLLEYRQEISQLAETAEGYLIQNQDFGEKKKFNLS